MAIQTKRPEPRYKDFYTNLDAHPVRQDLFVLNDDASIKVAIKNIIFTNPGERFFNPTFGAGINRTLFENITQDSEFIIKELVTAAIENYEPRANLIEVFVNAVPDENGYYLSIIFSTINNPSPQTLNVILTRVR